MGPAPPASAAAAAGPAKVCEQASALIAADEPEAALDLIKQLRSGKATTSACEAVRLRALAKIGAEQRDEATAEPSKPESAASTWQDFQDAYVEPIGKSVLPFLVALAGLLFLARLAMLLRLPISEKSSRRERRAFFWAGLLGVLLAAGSTAWMLPRLQGGWLAFLGIATALLGLTGCLCLARAWSSALRLSITTITLDAESEASSGRIVAMLQQLGADEPRGLEVPRGTDLKVLESVGLTSAPKSAVLAAVFQIAELLVPRSPWYIRVEGTDVDELAVSITRNRRHVASALINRDALRLRVPAPPAAGSTLTEATVEEASDNSSPGKGGPDLHWMAAAFILLTVIERYEVEEDQGALYGATDWRSVGAHAIATMTRWADPTTARPLLAQAVDWDPDNLAAQVSFWHAMWRQSTDVAELDDYCAALSQARRVADVRGGWSDLALRISRTLAAASINAYFARKTPGRLSRAEAATRDLLERVRADSTPATAARGPRPSLADQMAPSAAAMYLTCHERGNALWDHALSVIGRGPAAGRTPDATSRWSPSDRYNLACYLAMSPPGELDAAVRHIRVAEHLPDFGGWHLTDPQLKTVSGEPAWRTAFGAEPRKDLLAIAPFDTHRAMLEAAGLTTAESLARVATHDLGRLLAVDPVVASRMRALARVAARLVQLSPDFALELTLALDQRGLASLPLAVPLRTRRDITSDLQETLSVWPSSDQVDSWLS